MKLSVVIVCIVILELCQDAAGRKYRMCGSRLIDLLRVSCGSSGISDGRDYLRYKYPNLAGRSTRHLDSSMPQHLLNQIEEMYFEEQSRDTTPEDEVKRKTDLLMRLSEHMRQSNKAKVQRSTRKRSATQRSRRNIVKKCCYASCNLREIRRHYCARG